MLRGRRRRGEEAGTAAGTPPSVSNVILDEYVRSAPSPQNAIDIFAGEWSSAFPSDLGVTAGAAELFDDGRVSWLIEELGGIERKSVLELGPLEGGHTAMLDRAGAEVLAIEGNTRAYLKCLISKELLSLPRSRFVLGDFSEYLGQTDARFDLVLASGVLYHAPDPVGLLEAIARVTDCIGIWTHYYDDDVIRSTPAIARLFEAEPESREWHGHALMLHRRAYQEALNWGGFCGGPESSALWMERQGLVTVLDELGFNHVSVQSDDPHHQNGPCVMLCARRR